MTDDNSKGRILRELLERDFRLKSGKVDETAIDVFNTIVHLQGFDVGSVNLTYDDLTAKVSYTSTTVARVIKDLYEKNYIVREYRQIVKDGVVRNRMMHFGLNKEHILKLLEEIIRKKLEEADE